MNMKVILSLVIFSLFLEISQATENPNVRNSSRSPGVPRSSGQQQRFISNPGTNVYGRSSNDVVTGNVGGMKYFHGVVPYGSSYYTRNNFNSSGSSAVNNFLRRSANPTMNDRNPGQPRSYYDPSQTVSSYRRPDGTSGLSAPRLTGQGQTNSYILPQQINPSFYERYQQRPLSNNNMDLEQILARQEKLRQEAKTDTDQLDEKKIQKKTFFDSNLIAEEDKKQNEEKNEDQTEPTLRPEEQVHQEFQKENAEALMNQKSIRVRNENNPLLSKQTEDDSDSKAEEGADKAKLAEGRKILGKHTTFASLADEKFTTYMDTAESFVKEGQFYKAADTYTLASVWKPEDARGYLGQSFSLFGAGEYMSSAYYLTRAMELDSKETLKKYDLSAFIGDRDVFENRVLEISDWQQRSGSGELAFLLAYVSYQDSKAVRAKNAVNLAKTAMPDSNAVTILKNIIDPAEVLK